MWDRDAEDQGFVQSRRSAACHTSAVWKVEDLCPSDRVLFPSWCVVPSHKKPSRSLQVSLVLGVLVLTAGIATLSASYATAFKIESFGEGDLFFVDNQAVSFNRGVHSSGAAGLGLSCLGSGLAAVGLLLWLLQLPKVKERLSRRAGEAEERGGSGSAPGDAAAKSAGVDKGTPPVAGSKVQTEQPAP